MTLSRELTISEYCDAYEAANGYRPKHVRYERGWVRLPLNQNVRLAELPEYTERLRARASERGAVIQAGIAASLQEQHS